MSLTNDRLLSMLEDLAKSTRALLPFLENHPAAEEEVWDAEIKLASVEKAVELEKQE